MPIKRISNKTSKQPKIDNPNPVEKTRSKSKGKSPTVRTLELLRSRGETPWKTEHWNNFSRRRVDLYNFIDIVSLAPQEDGTSILRAIQATSTGVSSRMQKIDEIPAARLWLTVPGHTIEVWGWRKRILSNKRRPDYVLRIIKGTNQGKKILWEEVFNGTV